MLSTNTLTPPPLAANDTGPNKPSPRPPDKRQDYLMRQATRILSNGGTQADVVNYWKNSEGVKFKNEPVIIDPKTQLQGQGEGGLAALNSMVPGAGMTMKAVQGLTFGFGDKAIGSILGLVTGQGASKGIDLYRSALDAQQRQNPIGSTVAELVGSAAGGAGLGGALGLGARAATMGKAGRLGLMAGEGAMGGALSGAGNAEGPMSDRAKAAILGGVVGGLFVAGTAGTAQAAGTVVKPLLRGLTNWSETLQNALPGSVSASATARQHLADALSRDGVSIDQAIAKATKMAATGAPVTAADIGGENTLGLFQAASSLRGPAKQKLTEEMLNRQGDQGTRLLGTMFRSLKVGMSNAYDAADDIMAERAAAAAPLYTASYQQEVRIGPALQRLLKTPQGRRMYDIGRQIAADEDAAGLPRVKGALPVPALPSESGDVFESLIKQGVPPDKARAAAGGGAVSTLPIRGIDYMKRGLDHIVQTAGRDGNPPIDRQFSAALGKMVEDAKDEAGQQIPAYAQALSTYRGHSQALRALQLGKGGKQLVEGRTIPSAPFHTKPPEVIQKELANLSPAEQEMYRVGAFQDMADWVHSSSADAPNVAGQKFGGRVFGTSQKGMESRIRALVSDPDVAQQLVDHAMAEARISQTTGKLGGSRTAPLQSEMADLAGSVVTGRAGVTRTLFKAAGNRAKTGWSGAVSDELSNLLTKGLAGVDELTAMLTSLKGTGSVHRPGIAITAGQQVGGIQLR